MRGAAPGRPSPAPGRGAYAAIFALALSVRLAAVFATGPETTRFGDAPAYVGAAKSLVENGTYPDATDFRFFFRPPLYPIVLAVTTLGHPECVPCARAANAAVGSLVPLLLAALSARIFRRRGIAVATGVVAALHPAFVVASSEIQSEPLFTLLLLAAGFLLLVSTDRPSSNLAVLAGAGLALAALTRSTALALAPLMLAPLLDRRWPVRARAHLAGSAFLGFVLALSPWVLRNAVVYRELIVSSDAGGFALYCGNSDWTRRYYALRSRDEYLAWQAGIDAEMRRQLIAREHRGRLSPRERSALFRDLALDQVRRDPAAGARLLLRKAWHWIRPYPTPWYWPGWVLAATAALYVALDVLAVRGGMLAERRGVALFCAGVLGVSMAIHVVVIVVWRYRMPYWDPVLILFAVPGAWAGRPEGLRLTPNR